MDFIRVGRQIGNVKTKTKKLFESINMAKFESRQLQSGGHTISNQTNVPHNNNPIKGYKEGEIR